MSSAFISTSSLTSTLRTAAMTGQVALTKASTESTTGRYSDVPLDLGALTGRDVSLRAEVDRVDKIIDTNAVVTGRLDASQAAITSLMTSAQDFVQQLLASRDLENGATVVLPAAQTNLKSLVSTLNTTLYGQYLFGGINTGVKPMQDYTATSASKAAVDAAFLAEFGMSQSSAAVNTITPTAMDTFLAGNFATLYADPQWGGTWSQASSQVINSRVSTTQVVTASASANETAFRQLAQVYTMMSDLGGTKMSQGTYQTLVDHAATLASEAIGNLTQVAGVLGNSQQTTSEATDSLNIQKDLLTKQVSSMESVDQTAASVRVTSLQNQVETALALISRIQKLSILDYM
jgi:flagellar hook-associated protein 3 FlgL